MSENQSFKCQSGKYEFSTICGDSCDFVKKKDEKLPPKHENR